MYIYLAFVRTAGGFLNIWFVVMEDEMTMTGDVGGGICKDGLQVESSSAGGIL